MVVRRLYKNSRDPVLQHSRQFLHVLNCAWESRGLRMGGSRRKRHHNLSAGRHIPVRA